MFGEQDQQTDLALRLSKPQSLTLFQALSEDSMGISRRHPLLHLGGEESQLLYLPPRVQSVPTLASLWCDQAVAVLPVSKGYRPNSQHPSHCADAVDAVAGCLFLTHDQES